MIERIQPIANYKLIKDSAYMTVNFLKKNPKSADAAAAYKQYLSEGKKAPGYASTIMKLAKNDSFINDIKEMGALKISGSELKTHSKNLAVGFLDLLDKNESARLEFDKAGEKMYPRSWNIRKNILKCWRDNSSRSYQTKCLKDLKRNFEYIIQ